MVLELKSQSATTLSVCLWTAAMLVHQAGNPCDRPWLSLRHSCALLHKCHGLEIQLTQYKRIPPPLQSSQFEPCWNHTLRLNDLWWDCAYVHWSMIQNGLTSRARNE